MSLMNDEFTPTDRELPSCECSSLKSETLLENCAGAEAEKANPQQTTLRHHCFQKELLHLLEFVTKLWQGSDQKNLINKHLFIFIVVK